MQHNKTTAIIIGIIVIAIAGMVTFFQYKPAQNNTYTPPANTVVPDNSKTQTNTTTNNTKSYTLADVAKHSDKSSCWTTINGGVYDLTAWISAHPGGEGAILSICGKDGSNAFDNQHGGQGRPERTLATFKIGILTQ